MQRFFAITCLVSLAGLLASATADDAKAKPPKPYGKKLDKVDVTPKEWSATTATKTTSAAIDQLLLKLLNQEGLKTAPRTSDEQFLRRVTLDLTGKVPTPAKVKSF